MIYRYSVRSICEFFFIGIIWEVTSIINKLEIIHNCPINNVIPKEANEINQSVTIQINKLINVYPTIST